VTGCEIQHSVELLRDGKGIYGIGAVSEADAPPLILRRDRLEESGSTIHAAVLQMITGGFQHGMFSYMAEERLRKVIHHDLLRRKGLPMPGRELPYWSSDRRQQIRNRGIYHGLRLASLSIVNRLIASALQQAADQEAVKVASRFRFHYRYPIYRAAALNPRALQIATVFPVLSLAIFAIPNPKRPYADAKRLVEGGVSLKIIADLMHIPMAFRKIKPGAADLALSVVDAFDDYRLVHTYMPDSLPKMKLWLSCIRLAKDAGPEFVGWAAKHSLEIGSTPREAVHFLSDLRDWVRACQRANIPKHIFNAILREDAYRPRGEQFVVRPFCPDMSLKTVTKLSSNWHEAVANNMSGPYCEFPKPWFGATTSCGYEIVPITTTRDLYLEGKAMHHCVGSDAHRVHNGSTYFFLFAQIRSALPHLNCCGLTKPSNSASSVGHAIPK
jgi:hypothetical protein